jgi:trimeric autotransporter adhesin
VTPRRIARYLGLAVLLALAPVAARAAQQRIGVTGAVNPDAAGTPPGGQSRSLVIGTDIVPDERIVTEAAGQAQIVFLDRSAITVGPNSEVTIDEFVYDPEAKTGKIAANVTKGVFRFVGGALSKNEGAVSVKTPDATIGIRGAIVLFSVDAKTHVVEATLLYGNHVTLTADNGRQVVITRAGFSASFDPRSGGFSPPAPAPRIGEQMGRLDGRAGANPGAPPPPPGGPITLGNLARLNSSNLTGSLGDARSAQLGEGPPPPPLPNDPNPSAHHPGGQGDHLGQAFKDARRRLGSP